MAEDKLSKKAKWSYNETNDWKKKMAIPKSKISQTKNVEKKKLMVAAIDFGTTVSGWAFSFDHDFKSDPTKISCKQWCSGKHISMKAPTSVLIKPDGCTMEAFGYEAEDRYAELADDKEHHTYYYFQRFKMMLFDNKNLSRQEELEDDKGKRLPAKRVFSMVIKYLKDDLLEESGKKLYSGCIGEDEIQWVLTVPAIWNPLAKMFMRECAVEAGIKSANLLISLEPEAASLYCKYLTIKKEKDGNEVRDSLSSFKPGARYMVVDAGGGTIDIIVHEVCFDGKLKELYKANGGNWGGTRVDKAFFDFLTRIIGKNTMKRFKDEHKDDFLDLQREFEVKKRSIKPDTTSKVKMKIPVSLSDIYKDENEQSIMDKIKQDSSLNGKVNFMADKVLFESGLMKGLFDISTTNVVQHLKHILGEKSTKNTNTILMVGGFSESPMLFEAVRSAFHQQQVLLPEDAGLSVLKGAVIFGHNKKDISARISPYTYGFKQYSQFDPNKHPLERMFVSARGQLEVRGCFTKLIEAGDQLSPNAISTKKAAVPLDGLQCIAIKLFATQETNPVFVDEPGSFKLGELNVDCTDDEGNVGAADVHLMLGGTEFEVQAVLRSTGKVTKAIFSFLD